jgi:ATP phosphoribosyltransferase regulatory subunit
MLNLPAATPPGALDLTGDAARRRRALLGGTMQVLERGGYEELLPPTFEYEDVFLRAGGSGVAERLLRFPDRDGRILALRYDFTSSIARIAATTFAGAGLPLRLSYSGKVYRQEPERGGRPRETLQVGAELLGDGALRADVEIVRLTIELIRSAGLQDFQVNLGHVGVLAPGLAGLEEPFRAQVRWWIDRKDRAGLTRALSNRSGDVSTLVRLPFVIGRRDAIEAAIEEAPSTAAAGLRHLLALDDALSPGERRHVVYDLGEVRGLDYYTGVHFEVYVAGTGRAAGAGGRYDELMGRFGRPMPAVGLSLDLDAIAEVPL